MPWLVREPANSAFGTQRHCHSQFLPSKCPLKQLALQLSPAFQPWQAEQGFALSAQVGTPGHHRSPLQPSQGPLVLQPPQGPLVVWLPLEQAPPCPANSVFGTRRHCHSQCAPSKYPLHELALQLSPASLPWQAEQ